MRKLMLLLGVLAIGAFSVPAFADNTNVGTNPNAHGNNPNANPGASKPDPQPDHGKDNCNGCVG